MIVRTQPNGHGTTGLYIGTRNARRYFKRRINGIDLQLGHIHIHCPLSPEFWQGRPAIFDNRLSSWLDAKVSHERSCRAPIPILMIPAEKNSFKLHPMKLPSASTDRMLKIGTAAAQTRKAGTKQTLPAAPHRVPGFITSENNLSH